MLRALLLLLLLANAAFFVWSQGGFGNAGGAAAGGEHEPDRLARQVNPEAVQLLSSPVAASIPISQASAASAAASTASAISSARAHPHPHLARPAPQPRPHRLQPPSLRQDLQLLPRQLCPHRRLQARAAWKPVRSTGSNWPRRKLRWRPIRKPAASPAAGCRSRQTQQAPPRHRSITCASMPHRARWRCWKRCRPAWWAAASRPAPPAE
jgi:hypothetical protein